MLSYVYAYIQWDSLVAKMMDSNGIQTGAMLYVCCLITGLRRGSRVGTKELYDFPKIGSKLECCIE